MEFNVTLIPGDGIGPEIVREARKVLDRVAEKYSHRFTYKEVLMGGCFFCGRIAIKYISTTKNTIYPTNKRIDDAPPVACNNTISFLLDRIILCEPAEIYIIIYDMSDICN